ncbi:MAG: hypothetical protein BWZ10_02687 [candidate division BRC1 bacterium ADurb.BinA364]|nr:MAG: hypothetical protein BWZ10_02687 [candidate division BRC1 bacterium ADurb.BinA364]
MVGRDQRIARQVDIGRQRDVVQSDGQHAVGDLRCPKRRRSLDDGLDRSRTARSLHRAPHTRSEADRRIGIGPAVVAVAVFRGAVEIVERSAAHGDFGCSVGGGQTQLAVGVVFPPQLAVPQFDRRILGGHSAGQSGPGLKGEGAVLEEAGACSRAANVDGALAIGVLNPAEFAIAENPARRIAGMAGMDAPDQRAALGVLQPAIPQQQRRGKSLGRVADQRVGRARRSREPAIPQGDRGRRARIDRQCQQIGVAGAEQIQAAQLVVAAQDKQRRGGRRPQRGASRGGGQADMAPQLQIGRFVFPLVQKNPIRLLARSQDVGLVQRRRQSRMRRVALARNRQYPRRPAPEGPQRGRGGDRLVGEDHVARGVAFDRHLAVVLALVAQFDRVGLQRAGP